MPKFLNINCQEATLLGSKQVETKLTLMENIKLRFHYAICKPCEYFAQQVKLINTSLKKMSSDSTISFSEQKKNEIQEQLNNNLKDM